jgi:HAMP domain-containing protein
VAGAAGLGRRAGVAAALAIALMAAAGSRAQGRKLSAQLVPAAGGAVGLGNLYTAESGALRDYVTTGRARSLAEFRDAAADFPGQLGQVAGLVRGYPHIPVSVAAAGRAVRVWQGRVAGPQLAAAGRGDFAAARALQGDVTVTRPYSLAVRAGVAALQAAITRQQQQVTSRLLAGQLVLLQSLIAVAAVAAVIAAGGVIAVRRWLLRPFKALRAAADQVAAGHYDTQVPAGQAVCSFTSGGPSGHSAFRPHWPRMTLPQGGRQKFGCDSGALLADGTFVH